MSSTNDPEAESRLDSDQETSASARIQHAQMRLQRLTGQGDALDAIREIAIHFIGTEELALFRLDRQKAALWLFWCSGTDSFKYPFLDVFEEPLLQSVLAGKIVFLGDTGQDKLLSTEDPVSALVPILCEGETVGLLVIFRLLPPKHRLDAADRKICEAISQCASPAIVPTAESNRGGGSHDSLVKIWTDEPDEF